MSGSAETTRSVTAAVPYCSYASAFLAIASASASPRAAIAEASASPSSRTASTMEPRTRLFGLAGGDTFGLDGLGEFLSPLPLARTREAALFGRGLCGSHRCGASSLRSRDVRRPFGFGPLLGGIAVKRQPACGFRCRVRVPSVGPVPRPRSAERTRLPRSCTAFAFGPAALASACTASVSTLISAVRSANVRSASATASSARNLASSDSRVRGVPRRSSPLSAHGRTRGDRGPRGRCPRPGCPGAGSCRARDPEESDSSRLLPLPRGRTRPGRG